MKRTRPTSAWTGVALLVAAVAFVGGISLGRGIGASSPPLIPAPLPPAASPIATSPATPAPAATPPVGTSLTVSPPGGANGPEATAPAKPAAPFDAKAARAALEAAAMKTKSCRPVNEPKGSVATTVTFAPSGHVSDVTINTARYARTKTGTCIAARLSDAQVPAFSGFPAALKKTVAAR
jgi:hypothetical protein